MAVIKHQMQPIPFVEGNTFVVVDAGGGTVDITTHEVGPAKCNDIMSCALPLVVHCLFFQHDVRSDSARFFIMYM